MNPDDTQDNTHPTQPQRGQVAPPVRSYESHHDAVAKMTRQQIDQIYADQQAQASKQVDEPVIEDKTEDPAASAYSKTHTEQRNVHAKDWQHYHSSWQDYYQKYYSRYYAGAYQSAPAQAGTDQTASAVETSDTLSDDRISISRREAVQELRGQLLERVQDSAKKVRKSRHFAPLLSGFAVLFIFVFLQYNSNIIAYAQSYVSPGNIDPQNIIADPNLSLTVSNEPQIIIPKINVDIGVDYTATTDYESQMAAMKSGIAYFGIPGANSKPGQNGNVPLSGHSSNDFTDTGSAKFIFARLEQLRTGDVFYLNYKGTRYTYTVTKILVVLPSDVGALQIGDDKPYATLITCTPLGTAEKRLLVIGEQISPSPSTAEAAPATSGSSTAEAKMAGKSPTLIERAFGAR